MDLDLNDFDLDSLNNISLQPQVSLSKKKVALNTLGCRLNFSETGHIAQGFADRGYEIVDFGENADVVMINTCTVTDGADSSCRNLIRKAHHSSPEAKIVVVGCYAQMEPEKIRDMQGVDLVLGNSEKFKIFEYLDEEQEDIVKVDSTNEFWGASTTLSDSHTRAFLKIQDGCNYICSFCIIPQARGRSRTISIDKAVEQAQKIVNDGFKEIVLTGVNIGEFERSSGERLADLLKRVLEIEGLERLRLSSVEANTITDELLTVMKSSPKFLDHFHIPMQSGDDEILSSMRRRYSVSEYREIVYKIKSYFPEAAIGADVIVGYPGETEEQFENTFNLLKELPITHFHVFPYSKRKGTTAAKLDNHIHTQTKKERVKALTHFGEAKLNQFAKEQLGKINSVLFEKKNKNGFWQGYTTNFVRVLVKSDQDLSNMIIPTFLKSASMGELHGELVN